MPSVQIIIQNGEKVFEPVVEEGITWETERKGVPGKLTFNVLKDDVIDFTEGNTVKMAVDSKNVFYGYVFTKKRDKDGIISVTAYDQLRYLKNKDALWYINKSAADVVKMLAADFKLKVGEIEDTVYVIPKRNEENVTLFDIIQNALDLTLLNKKKLYVLYDDFGQLTLKDVESMKLDLLIDGDTAENYNYVSSIDSSTYNRIRLYYDNKDTGKRELYITLDSSTQLQWGILQYCESIEETCNGKAKADALLQLYNRKTRNLSINNAFGDTRVRAGTSIGVQLDLGDIAVNNYMLVEKAKHVFNNKEHLMNLTLRGGDFV
ncbi:XkdQ/YqbQ family protein [Anaerospora hongkongensis]|uniref:XkdQ/YqbQ family protein n=1 Tax=Anaerospora hongkongensis TaxID=244830 RepID=UPI00289CEC5B|nr:hydrolase [Anaerospora hongkongensis]